MSDNGRCTLDEASHVYRVRGVEIPGVSTVLSLAGLEPAFTVDPVTLQLAAQRGTCVHEATAIDDRHFLGVGRPLDMTQLEPELVPYVLAWRAFREREPFQLDPTRIEELVWQDGLEPFAGTLDREGTWNGRPAILDIKTVKELRWTMGVQLAGYAIGARQRRDDVDEAQDYCRVLVQLRADGGYRVYASDDGSGKDYLSPDDVATFLAALHIAHRKLARPRTKLPLVAPETGDVEVP